MQKKATSSDRRDSEIEGSSPKQGGPRVHRLLA